MKSENEDLRKDETWAEHIEDEMAGNIENLDTDFPLSGGEEPLTAVPDDIEEVSNEEDTEKTSFQEDLETEFPLSGGEVER